MVDAYTREQRMQAALTKAMRERELERSYTELTAAFARAIA